MPVEPKTIAIGYEPVILDKLYGPSIFANLRITADPQRGWLIERAVGDGWVEWCIIPAQLQMDFDERPDQRGAGPAA